MFWQCAKCYIVFCNMYILVTTYGINKWVAPLSSIKFGSAIDIKSHDTEQSFAICFFYRSTGTDTKQPEWQEWKRPTRAGDVCNLSWTPVEANVLRIEIHLQCKWRYVFKEPGLTFTCYISLCLWRCLMLVLIPRYWVWVCGLPGPPPWSSHRQQWCQSLWTGFPVWLSLPLCQTHSSRGWRFPVKQSSTGIVCVAVVLQTKCYFLNNLVSDQMWNAGLIWPSVSE